MVKYQGLENEERSNKLTVERTSYYIINAITLYRLVASFLLLYLIITDQYDIFKWLLVLSFFTDLIDGWLARKFKVNTKLGAIFDSIADDLTVLVAVIGLFVFKPEFIRQNYMPLVILFVVFLVQMIFALIRYGKISSFHTYLAKLAAILQGVFLILIYFLSEWPMVLFYVAVGVTFLELLEEIIIIALKPKWETDVKGLYWVLKK